MGTQYLKDIFAEKLLKDEREPVLTFEIPGWEGTFGLFAPLWEPWKQLILLVLILQLMQALFAVVIYKTIIPNRGTIGAYLVGWGVIMPISLWIPFEILEILDVQNLVLKLAPCQLPMVVFFRTIEAMYGTSPPIVEATQTNYMIYYTATVHYVWDPKTLSRVKVTLPEALKNFFRVAYYFHLLSLSLSILMHYKFAPFESPVTLDDYHFNFDLLRPNHLANAYCLAVHTYFHLLVGFELTNFGENLKGYLTKPTFLNPLWTSTSPTDFWGRKWNLMIHNVLKGGAFLPAKKSFPTNVAVLISFIVSGLVHDYTWSLIFYHHRHTRDETGICQHCFSPKMLKLTAFFLWNGVVMLLERPLGKYPPFSLFSKYLPLPVLSTLVILTALPVSHWYTGDWAVGGYFAQFAPALWTIRKLD